MSLQSPLGRSLGLGSAKSGTDHWWSQRLTAVALVPLTIWFALSLLGLGAYDYSTVRLWMAEPLTAVLLVALLIALMYHAALGLQVVIEDYVHSAGLKVSLLLLMKLAYMLFTLAGIFSVIVIAIGSAA